MFYKPFSENVTFLLNIHIPLNSTCPYNFYNNPSGHNKEGKDQYHTLSNMVYSDPIPNGTVPDEIERETRIKTNFMVIFSPSFSPLE